MRNRRSGGIKIGGVLLLMMLAGGCAPEEAADAKPPGTLVQPAAPPTPTLSPKDIPQALTEAYAAFERKQYDAAMAGAQRVVAAAAAAASGGKPQAAGLPEAHYLRGRVL